MAAPLSPTEIARELADYQVVLSARSLAQLSCYLELLLRWNRRINLTGVRQPREIVRRLFGESLFLSRVLELEGWLVDIGSGAGFPGLALKLVAPDLRLTLVEARQRKCAFLKEVCRECGFYGVDVVTQGFESWAAGVERGLGPQLFTTRAVAINKSLLRAMACLLGPTGRAAFLTTPGLAARIHRLSDEWSWEAPVLIPGGGAGVVIVGMPFDL